MSENRRVRRNKDSDLLKIQILADYYQASFSFLGSIVSGALIGLLVVAITLRFENVFSDIGYYVFLGIICPFFLFYGRRTYRSYYSDLEKIDKLFIRVQNGETLPSITELMKKKKKKPVVSLISLRTRITGKVINLATIEEAESTAVEFVKKKKNVQEVKVSETSRPDPSKPDNWVVKGSYESEKFIVEVDEKGTVVAFKFEPKTKPHIH